MEQNNKLPRSRERQHANDIDFEVKDIITRSHVKNSPIPKPHTWYGVYGYHVLRGENEIIDCHTGAVSRDGKIVTYITERDYKHNYWWDHIHDEHPYELSSERLYMTPYIGDLEDSYKDSMSLEEKIIDLKKRWKIDRNIRDHEQELQDSVYRTENIKFKWSVGICLGLVGILAAIIFT